jgi:hypothetical protein
MGSDADTTQFLTAGGELRVLRDLADPAEFVFDLASAAAGIKLLDENRLA